METVAIGDAVGRTLASDIRAAVDSPVHDISAMDDYALNSIGTFPLRVIGEGYAGEGDRPLDPGEAIHVGTGGQLPTDADAVLKIVDAVVESSLLVGPPARPFEYMVRLGALLLPRGHDDLAVDGRPAPRHRRRAVRRPSGPRVAVISMGDEILDGYVPDIKAPLCCALLEAWGCDAVCADTVGDSMDALHLLLEEARDPRPHPHDRRRLGRVQGLHRPRCSRGRTCSSVG